MAHQVTNLTRIHVNSGSIPALTQWAKDPALLWLWCRSPAAALIQPLAWELPYATGAAIKSKKKQKQKQKQKQNKKQSWSHFTCTKLITQMYVVRI